MKTFEYHPFSQTVTLHFTCPDCGEDISTDALSVPQANMTADRASDSENAEEYEIYCQNCDWSSQVDLYTRYDGGCGQIENLDPDWAVDVDEEIAE